MNLAQPRFVSGLVACLSILCVPLRAETVSYTSFEGDTYMLAAWRGSNVAVLTQDASLDPVAMGELVGAIDQGYSVYQTITGREPNPWGPTTLDGLSTIAQVDSTCGAGCGYLGFTGIEILSSFFEDVYDATANDGQYDQLPFYELGRNFWFYGDQLGTVDPFVTGFAIANRFVSMQESGLDGAPFNDLSFNEFREDIVHNLRQAYLTTPGADWETTIGAGQSVPNPNNWGAADLAASFFHTIYEQYGLEAYADFFAALAQMPAASTPIDAIEHFQDAAFAATGDDYQRLFYPPAFPADLDGDNDVDDADFGLAFAAFTGPGSGPGSNPSADLDFDGDVDDADYGLAFAAFTGPGAAANIPEPGSAGLLLLIVAAAGMHRQRV